MYSLTLQVYWAGPWRDAMALTFNDPAIALGKLDQRLTAWGLQ